jgi:hypothetical protein
MRGGSLLAPTMGMFLAACSAPAMGPFTVFADPGEYEFHSCEQLAAVRPGLKARAHDLKLLIQDRAEHGRHGRECDRLQDRLHHGYRTAQGDICHAVRGGSWHICHSCRLLLLHRANRRAPRRVAAITTRQSRDDHCTRSPSSHGRGFSCERAC